MEKWERLPQALQKEAVRPYYDALREKSGALFCKRFFDIMGAALLCVPLAPAILVLCAMIKADSPGPAIFRQTRVTRCGREFSILKLRTMVADAPARGGEVTAKDDARVTKLGKKLRRLRIDEFPQVFNVLKGDMSFVGPRPEVPKYVARYTDEMRATLLVRAGVTSPASVKFKDEEELLAGADDVDAVYVERILPLKMAYNLQYLREFSIKEDMKELADTVRAVRRG